VTGVDLEPDDLAGRIRDLLRARLPSVHDLAVSPPTRIFGGNARRAWACEASWTADGTHRVEPMILLVRLAGSQVRTDPAWEVAVLDTLTGQRVRAPKVWGHDVEGRLFGSPAVLLQRLPGRADAVEYLGAPWEVGRARTLDLARAAAELHAAQPGGQRPDGPPRQESQLAFWRSRFEASRPEPHPALSWLFDWLERHEAAPARRTLVHGDLRPGNVLYDGAAIVGLLDWEMAHVGDPVEDLAWAYRALWSPRRFVPLEEFVAAYEAAGGPPVAAESLRWNRIFCEVRYATISLQAARSFLDGHSRNLRLIDRARTVPPAVRLCLEWISAADPAVAPC
jgi:aminoglycoside phosphotransferase (APT) family kinase protein